MNSSIVMNGPALTVTDLKNYIYCPRVPFYSTFLARRPTTFKMEAGRDRHEQVSELEERRSLRAYGVQEGEREFRVRLYSAELGVSGVLDMVIVRGDEAIPVEFKATTGTVGQNHLFQIGLYALLVEAQFGRPVRRGFIYLIPQKKAKEVAITDDLRRMVLNAVDELRTLLRIERKPEPTRYRACCVDCEFRRYCADLD